MTPENYKLINYSLYALITAGVTVTVGRSLFRSGRVFLDECFDHDADMAGSVNRLLLVGFYLVNFGGLALFLKLAEAPTSPAGVIESLAFKVGMALTGLGCMHLFNMRNFDRMRTRSLERKRAEAYQAGLAAAAKTKVTTVVKPLVVPVTGVVPPKLPEMPV